LSKTSLLKAIEWLKASYETPKWLLIMLGISALVSMSIIFMRIKASRKPHTPLISHPDDAIIKILEWWPKQISGGFLPNDVHVDFKQLERELHLAPEMAQKVMARVIEQNGFQEKKRGPNFAIYTY